MEKQTITIYHSPDSDDAFMFYGFVHGGVKHPEINFKFDSQDIESLNQRTLNGELDVTAVSVHSFPYLKNRYAILTVAASMGGIDYGPKIVVKEQLNLKDGVKRKIATPGKYTSAALALKIYLHENNIDAEVIDMNFDEVQSAIKSGQIDAGVIIHEGQITHQRQGLITALDLGQWWYDKTSLPLPLGVNVARKDFGVKTIEAIRDTLRESIQCAFDNREKALDYAQTFNRDVTREELDKFVSMYVNEKALDIGEEGVQAITKFLELGKEHNLISEDFEIDFV